MFSSEDALKQRFLALSIFYEREKLGSGSKGILIYCNIEKYTIGELFDVYFFQDGIS